MSFYFRGDHRSEMKTYSPMTAEEFGSFLAQVRYVDARVSKQHQARKLQRLKAKQTLRAKPAQPPPPPPKTPHQMHDASRRKERDAKHESELLDRKFKHDALPTAPVNRDNGPLLFTGMYGSTSIQVRPKRKQARWEKEQHFDQGVL